MEAYRSESVLANCVYLNEHHNLRALSKEAPIWHSKTTAKERGDWISQNYNKVKEAYCREHGGGRLVICSHSVKNMLMNNILCFF